MHVAIHYQCTLGHGLYTCDCFKLSKEDIYVKLCKEVRCLALSLGTAAL